MIGHFLHLPRIRHLVEKRKKNLFSSACGTTFASTEVSIILFIAPIVSLNPSSHEQLLPFLYCAICVHPPVILPVVSRSLFHTRVCDVCRAPSWVIRPSNIPCTALPQLHRAEKHIPDRNFLPYPLLLRTLKVLCRTCPLRMV